MPPTLIEQRVFHRLAVALDVGYRVANDATGVPFTPGRSANLSSGGMLLDTPYLPQPLVPALLAGHEHLELCFAIDGLDLRLRARLIWLQGPEPGSPGWRLGLKFVDASESTRDRLHAFVVANPR